MTDKEKPTSASASQAEGTVFENIGKKMIEQMTLGLKPATLSSYATSPTLAREQAPTAVLTQGGQYTQNTFTNEHDVEITVRNPVSPTSPAGRDRSGDHHMEIPQTASGGSLVSSRVSGVKLGGETYTVEVSNTTGGLLDGSQYVGIARDSDRMNNVVSLNEAHMSKELKEKIQAAVSPKGDGGTALTYKEAEGILKDALCSPRTPPEPQSPGGKTGRAQGE